MPRIYRKLLSKKNNIIAGFGTKITYFAALENKTHFHFVSDQVEIWVDSYAMAEQNIA